MLAHVIELRAGPARVSIDPASGGRIAALAVGGTDVVVPRRAGDHVMLWGSFPMVPYAGRVRDGRFVLDGVEHALLRNLPPHAGHGTVYDRPWQRVDDGSDTPTVALTCPLGDRWPLGGDASQTFTLTPSALHCTLAVTAGTRSMPAEVGWHTWFATRLPVELSADAMYERGPDGLPTGRLIGPAPPPWDDCFVTAAPVGLHIGALDVQVTSDCDHVVVFDALDVGTAVEPQSGPPDAFHLRRRVLAPGEALERRMTIAWKSTTAGTIATGR
ncbi:MAG: aldose epimerase [Ilumatobacteraceae bacterium]